MARTAEWRERAAQQHGLIARRQLVELGMTEKALRHAVASGQLRRIGPRVLVVVGSPSTPAQRALAAVLDASEAAVALSSALALRGVPGWRIEPVHVLTTRRPHRGSPHLGIVHSTVRLDAEHVTVVDGIPVTTPARTLLDLSLRLRPAKLEDLCDDLLRPGFMTPGQLGAVADGLPDRPLPVGWAVLRRLAAARPEGFVSTGSKLERRFERILEEAGDAPFDRQVDVGDASGWIGRVDFADRRLKVIVEVQGDAFHSTISDRRRDAERIARLRAAGWIVVEISEAEILHSPQVVLARVRAARDLGRALAA